MGGTQRPSGSAAAADAVLQSFEATWRAKSAAPVPGARPPRPLGAPPKSCQPAAARGCVLQVRQAPGAVAPELGRRAEGVPRTNDRISASSGTVSPCRRRPAPASAAAVGQKLAGEEKEKGAPFSNCNCTDLPAFRCLSTPPKRVQNKRRSKKMRGQMCRAGERAMMEGGRSGGRRSKWPYQNLINKILDFAKKNFHLGIYLV